MLKLESKHKSQHTSVMYPDQEEKIFTRREFQKYASTVQH